MKKATLLIRNIEKIYTMQRKKGEDVIYTHGAIAFHHDEILYVGEDDGSRYIDSDTRIIDGTNQIAFPAFIECNIDVNYSSFDEERKLREKLYLASKKGVLTYGCKQLSSNIQDVYWKLTSLQNMKYPLCSVKEVVVSSKKWKKKRFCISSASSIMKGEDQLLMARLLHLHSQTDAMTLLKALTLYPSRCLKGVNTGVLEKGRQGDVLLVYGNHINEVFSVMEECHFSHIIKSGVHIFPNLII